MRPLALVLALTVLGAPLGADALPPAVHEALVLELQGRLSEALERYRAALSSVTTLVQDETMSQPLTVRVFSKAAHLSLDLGLGEEAWDLGGRLLSAKNQPAAEAGTLVRMRVLRVQERWKEALELFEQYSATWPLPPGPSLLNEVLRVRLGAKTSVASIESLLRKAGGPASWTLSGVASLLPGPTEAWDLDVTETVRIQVGAFKDWGNALTLIDMLREKGWSPFTDIRTAAGGEKLHLVYIISRQPASDRARLEAQGLTALP